MGTSYIGVENENLWQNALTKNIIDVTPFVQLYASRTLLWFIYMPVGRTVLAGFRFEVDDILQFVMFDIHVMARTVSAAITPRRTLRRYAAHMDLMDGLVTETH